MKTGILLSGGMDSAALAFWKKPNVAFTVNYGQICAQGEIEAASAICTSLGISHEIISVDCHQLGSGDMSGVAPDPLAPVSEWWPYRNQLLLTLAAMRAIALSVDVLLFGSVKSDAAHVDGQKEFFERMDAVISMQEGNLKINAPAIEFTTAELIQKSAIPQSILAWSHSCHVSNFACGNCRGCYKYLAVLRELGYEAR